MKSPIEIEGKVVSVFEAFCCSGSSIQKIGDVEDDICHRIKARWMKWMMTSRVLCDRKMPTKLKEKCYKTIVRPTILHGS